MKPESRHALMELISYGVEELSSEEAAHLMSRVHECTECTGQWVLFQKTYTVLSQSGKTEVSVERSQQMWLACVEHAQHKKPAIAQSHGRSEVVPVSFRSDSSQREGDRRISSPSPTWLQTLRDNFASRLPYALAGGAFALLTVAYFAAPNVPNPAPDQMPRVSLQAPIQAPLQNTLSLATSNFQAPPRATTGMIEYHSAMGFEPFSDHLTSTLVSTSATQP